LSDVRIGKVEGRLEQARKDHGVAHLTLFDPEKLTPHSARRLGLEAKTAGTVAAMVGGSTAASIYELDAIVKAVKSTGLPVILFPNDVVGISQYADAVFFMSLLNSMNPYYLSGAQALGAPLVKKYRIEAIPLAYLIIGEHPGAAGFVGNANPIPNDKPGLAAMYALAAQYLGMRFLYLEAGSGARQTVSAEMIRAVKENTSIRIVVGGGIRTPLQAKSLADAGADLIVTGTVSEGQRSARKIRSIIRALR
jgi:phosphoglycerol geranylgeranyltransferase